MFTLKRSGTNARQVSTSSAQAGTNVGATSFQRRIDTLRKKIGKPAREDREFQSVSSMPVPTTTNTDLGTIPIVVDASPMLTGFTPTSERVPFYAICRDIYYNDPIGGGSADLMSMLPFGEFHLGGTQNKKFLEPYESACERLNTKTLVREISLDYLVLGLHTSSLLYNKEAKRFTDVLPHAPENIKITPLPFYSQDPILTVDFPQEMTEILSTDSARVRALMKRMGNDVFEKIKSGSLELDPLSTLYIPRRSFTNNVFGTSYFRRLIPYYLIEKNLYRGTLVESTRRQRGILHATMEENENFSPTNEDLEFLTDLLMNADSDPVGAIIATKSGIMLDEFRQGGDFWKVTDFSDSILSHKLRALGISEGFLSGEANYSTAESALSVFLEMIRTYREEITRKVFYNKLFPMISISAGLASRNGNVVRRAMEDDIDIEEALFQMNDGSRLFIPSVHWTKQLKPEGDSAYLEMLSGMTEKGVPVPLRMLAAAGGLNLDELLRQQEDDLALRKSMGEYMKKIDALAPKEAEGMDAESSAFRSNSQSAFDPRIALLPGARSAVKSALGQPPALLNRDFGDTGELFALSRTGKKKHIINQRAANERINRMIAKAAKTLTSR